MLEIIIHHLDENDVLAWESFGKRQNFLHSVFHFHWSFFLTKIYPKYMKFKISIETRTRKPFTKG